MRNIFGELLKELNDMLIQMGASIERSIAWSTQALQKLDIDLAKKAIDYDDDIDRQEKDIEALCLKILLRQQPIARDLRLISAALKMITDMERIGDQAADIAEITVMMAEAGTPHITELDHIPKMADATVKMVTDSIDAFVKKDLDLAKAVIQYDDVVDELFTKVRHDLIELIRAKSENGEQAMDLLMIAKYFERIGDHAVNIAEWVLFSITGTHVKG